MLNERIKMREGPVRLRRLTLAVMLSHTDRRPLPWLIYFLVEGLIIALPGWMKRHLSTRVYAA
jgi:hypothetical protein